VIHKTFIVSHMKEDAILGMPFLEKHRCPKDFLESAVMMAGKELACVDRFGRPLLVRVQVPKRPRPCYYAGSTVEGSPG